MRYLVILFLLILTSPAFSQTKIKYTYDNAGNRIKREMTPMFREEIVDRGAIPDSSWTSDQIRVFPNPTLDYLYVALPPGIQETGSLQLFDPAGRLVRQEPLSSETTSLDMTGQPNGNYALVIRLGQRTLHWKVVVVR